jgi:hypothetical protein
MHLPAAHLRQPSEPLFRIFEELGTAFRGGERREGLFFASLGLERHMASSTRELWQSRRITDLPDVLYQLEGPVFLDLKGPARPALR